MHAPGRDTYMQPTYSRDSDEDDYEDDNTDIFLPDHSNHADDSLLDTGDVTAGHHFEPMSIEDDVINTDSANDSDTGGNNDTNESNENTDEPAQGGLAGLGENDNDANNNGSGSSDHADDAASVVGQQHGALMDIDTGGNDPDSTDMGSTDDSDDRNDDGDNGGGNNNNRGNNTDYDDDDTGSIGGGGAADSVEVNQPKDDYDAGWRHV